MVISSNLKQLKDETKGVKTLGGLRGNTLNLSSSSLVSPGCICRSRWDVSILRLLRLSAEWQQWRQGSDL